MNYCQLSLDPEKTAKRLPNTALDLILELRISQAWHLHPSRSSSNLNLIFIRLLCSLNSHTPPGGLEHAPPPPGSPFQAGRWVRNESKSARPIGIVNLDYLSRHPLHPFVALLVLRYYGWYCSLFSIGMELASVSSEDRLDYSEGRVLNNLIWNEHCICVLEDKKMHSFIHMHIHIIAQKFNKKKK